MPNKNTQSESKPSGPTIVGKDNRTQAEKDKQQAAMKKDASGKSDKKAGERR